MTILNNSLCFVLACDLGTYMQPLLHDALAAWFVLFEEKKFKHLVSSSSVCSLNWLQALVFLLVGFIFFPRFARLQKPRIKLIVNFKDAVMTFDLGLCKSHFLSWWIPHERKATHVNFIPYSTYFPLKLTGKGGGNCYLCHLSSAEPDSRQMNFSFVFI